MGTVTRVTLTRMVLAALLGVAILGAGRAQALIYMPDPSGEQLVTANDDASNLQQTILPVSGGVASDGTYVYYGTADRNTGQPSIGRMRTDGSGANNTFMAVPLPACAAGSGGKPSADSIAVDAGHIYWLDREDNTIGRANLDGSGPDPQFIVPGGSASSNGGCGALGVESVTVDSRYVYWTNIDDGTIGRANLDGSGQTPAFLSGAFRPSGIAVTGSDLYWLNSLVSEADGTGWVGHAALDSTGAVVAASVNQTDIGPFPSFGDSEGLAATGGFVYFDGGDAWIGRAALDGSQANLHFLHEVADASTSLFTPIAVDDVSSDQTNASLGCSPSTVQLLYPFPGSDIGLPVVKDTTRCTLTVRDAGSSTSPLSGPVGLAQSPTELNLSRSCHQITGGPGPASCSFSAQTDATVDGFRGPSPNVRITATFGGNLAHNATSASTGIAVQQVRGCGLTRDGEIHFDAWLCPANSRTPLTALHAAAKVAGGTLTISSPYACEVFTTPITFSATFTPGAHSHARVTKVVFSFGAAPRKTAHRSPFTVRFGVAHKSAAKRKVTATAVASLTKSGHHLTGRVHLSVPHC